jgi:hypothetical protein
VPEMNEDSVKQKYIEHMGPELGLVYHALIYEMTLLTVKWVSYNELFGTKARRIELLNQASGFFFHFVQESLWDDILLHISRMTDPARMNRKERLSISQIPEIITDDNLREEISNLVKTANEKAGLYCRKIRNSRIAHKDLQQAIGEKSSLLDHEIKPNISEVLNALTKVMNLISIHYMKTQVSFMDLEAKSAVLSLLLVLDDGLMKEQERQEKLRRGEYDPQDFQNRDL